MLTKRRRDTKPEDVTDTEIREGINRAKQTVRSIEREDPADVVRNRRADANIKAMEKALKTIELGEAELRSREHEHIAANAPARRALRDKEDARRARRKALAPVVGALEYVRRRAHPELRGCTLVADRLAPEEGAELSTLVSKAKAAAFREEAPPLTEAETARYEMLVGTAAGDPELFAKKRKEQETRARVRALGEERRVASLPRRPQLAEAGSIELPRVVFTWLKNAKDGNWTVAHVGALATLMLSFENRDASLITGARFEEVDGASVLVIPGGVGGQMGFSGSIGGNSFDPTESGFVRLRTALRDLVRNDWLVAEVTAAETRVRLGPRVKTLRAGRRR